MRCPFCNKENPDGAKFCGGCGKNLDQINFSRNGNEEEHASDPARPAGINPADGKGVKKREKMQVFVLIAAVVIIAVAVWLYFFVLKGKLSGYERDAGLTGADAGNMNLLDLSEMGLTASDADEAIEVLDSLSGVLNTDMAQAELSLLNENAFSGSVYYRFGQEYNGLAVVGRAVVLATDEEGNVQLLTENLSDMSGAATEAQIDEETAVSAAKEYLETAEETEAAAELCYYEAPDADAPVLTYAVEAGFYTIYVDAAYGTVIGEESSVSGLTGYNADGTSEVPAAQADGFYYLLDEDRNILIGTYDGQSSDVLKDLITDDMLVRSENLYFGDTQDEINLEYSKGIDLLTFIQQLYDFYDQKYGQKGYEQLIALYNDGYSTGIQARGGKADVADPYMTIFFEEGECGYVSVCLGIESYDDLYDLIGHEYTHMVIYSVGGLSGSSESGAINEGIADIMGILIDASLNEEDPDWIMYGSEGDNIRNIMDPDDSGEPGKHLIYYEDYNEDIDGHNASTIISHAAYLMWEGRNGNSAGAINDADVLAELWYRTILLMNADATFADCRTACEAAAVQMQELGLLSEEQIETIVWAFDQAGITYSTDIKSNDTLILTVYDCDGNETADYTLTITDSSGTNTAAYTGAEEGPSFSLTLSAGIYTISVISTEGDYAAETSTVTVNSVEKYRPLGTDAAEEVKINFHTTFGTSLSGQVTDSSAQPLEGVRVTVEPAQVGLEAMKTVSEESTVAYSRLLTILQETTGSYTYTTDSNGGFSGNLPVGIYQMTYELDGYEIASAVQLVKSGSNTAETVVMEGIAEDENETDSPDDESDEYENSDDSASGSQESDSAGESIYEVFLSQLQSDSDNSESCSYLLYDITGDSDDYELITKTVGADSVITYHFYYYYKNYQNSSSYDSPVAEVGTVETTSASYVWTIPGHSSGSRELYIFIKNTSTEPGSEIWVLGSSSKSPNDLIISTVDEYDPSMETVSFDEWIYNRTILAYGDAEQLYFTQSTDLSGLNVLK